jgi:hypothetical protein
VIKWLPRSRLSTTQRLGTNTSRPEIVILALVRRTPLRRFALSGGSFSVAGGPWWHRESGGTVALGGTVSLVALGGSGVVLVCSLCHQSKHTSRLEMVASCDPLLTLASVGVGLHGLGLDVLDSAVGHRASSFPSSPPA